MCRNHTISNKFNKWSFVFVCNLKSYDIFHSPDCRDNGYSVFPTKKCQIHNKPSEPSIAIDKRVDKDKLLMNLRCEFYNAKFHNLVLRLATQHHIFPYHTRSPNQTFRQQDGIVAKEKLEVAGDNFLDLFFDLKLNLGIECVSGSGKHEGNSLLFFQIKIHPSPFSKILKRERPDRQSFIMNEINIH